MASLRSQQHNGLLLLTLGAAIDSTSGLFSRIIPVDAFTLSAGRGIFAFAFLLAILLWRHGPGTLKALLGIGAWGFVFAFLNASGSIVNILSLKYAPVANFFMIFAAAPFAAALAGRLVLGERFDLATLLTAIAGFAGVAIMMVSSAASEGFIGNLFACVCIVTYAAIVLILRRNPQIDIMPAICVTVGLGAVMALPFSQVGWVAPQQWLGLAAFGIVQLGLGNVLIFSGVSRIPAAQGGLLGILIAAFAPIWVFVFLGEVPPAATLLGGGIILAAAAARIAWMMVQSRPVVVDAAA